MSAQASCFMVWGNSKEPLEKLITEDQQMQTTSKFGNGVRLYGNAQVEEMLLKLDISLSNKKKIMRQKVAPIVIDVLKQWRESLPEHMRWAVANDIFAPDAVVFPNDRGEMRTYNGFRTTYRRFMADNNLGEYNLHSYRYTFATMLLERGVNPKIVRKMLGHADIETTSDTYSHV